MHIFAAWLFDTSMVTTMLRRILSLVRGQQPDAVTQPALEPESRLCFEQTEIEDIFAETVCRGRKYNVGATAKAVYWSIRIGDHVIGICRTLGAQHVNVYSFQAQTYESLVQYKEITTRSVLVMELRRAERLVSNA